MPLKHYNGVRFCLLNESSLYHKKVFSHIQYQYDDHIDLSGDRDDAVQFVHLCQNLDRQEHNDSFPENSNISGHHPRARWDRHADSLEVSKGRSNSVEGNKAITGSTVFCDV